MRRPDRAVSDDALIDVDAEPGYASRGALKLAPALDRFGVDPTGRVCADIGASTGGFTDILLRRGAEKVFALDVGRGLLHWRLRQDPRVVVLERINARDLVSFPEPVSLVVADLSFISLEKVLPAIRRAAPRAEVVALFKPQFEVGRSQVGKGGIVRDEAAVESALLRFREWCAANGYEVTGEAPSDLAGADGLRRGGVHAEGAAARRAHLARRATVAGAAHAAATAPAPGRRAARRGARRRPAVRAVRRGHGHDRPLRPARPRLPRGRGRTRALRSLGPRGFRCTFKPGAWPGPGPGSKGSPLRRGTGGALDAPGSPCTPNVRRPRSLYPPQRPRGSRCIFNRGVWPGPDPRF